MIPPCHQLSRLTHKLAAVLPKLINLTTFSIYANDVSAGGCEPLVVALPWSSLQVVNLGCNPLGAEGIEVLAHVLHQAPCLAELGLEAVDMGDQGATALARTLPGSIQEVDASHNGIGEDGVRAFVEALRQRAFPHFRKLDLRHNVIGPAGEALLHSLPSPPEIKWDVTEVAADEAFNMEDGNLHVTETAANEAFDTHDISGSLGQLPDGFVVRLAHPGDPFDGSEEDVL